jgi:SPP1 family phage portal protein
MADEMSVISNDLFGRLDIYASSDEITPDNVVSELNTALPYHVQNLLQEDFLYWYRRNVQPILHRHKDVRPEIMNIVQENHADEICTFKNGYFLTQPAFYTARREGAQGKVDKLNEFLYRSYKQVADDKIVNWFHTVGKGVLYVEPDRDNDPETPVHCYTLDPRSAFVVYSLKPGNEPVMGVNMVVVDDRAKFDVFTRKWIFHLSGGVTGKMLTTQVNSSFLATAFSVDSVEPNALGLIPIIEYRYNSVNMGAFEAVLPLLDAINNVISNRIDGVEQFIQSLAVATNCEFPDGTTANDIQKAGMIVLKSIGENKADFKILSEQLNQSETQVLVDHLYEQVLRICAMPSTTKGGTSTSDTGAAVLARDGWFNADCAARNCADLFRESNRQFDRIFVEILQRRGLLDISLSDFELNIVRNETANIQSKAQAFNTMLSSGLHPELAAYKSGISNDPVADMKMSEKYLRMIWGDPDKADEVEQQTNGQGEAEIIERDSDNGEDETGGAV